MSNPTKLLLSCFELSWVELSYVGFWQLKKCIQAQKWKKAQKRRQVQKLGQAQKVLFITFCTSCITRLSVLYGPWDCDWVCVQYSYYWLFCGLPKHHSTSCGIISIRMEYLLQQENKANKERLSWALPHSNFLFRWSKLGMLYFQEGLWGGWDQGVWGTNMGKQSYQ